MVSISVFDWFKIFMNDIQNIIYIYIVNIPTGEVLYKRSSSMFQYTEASEC